MRRITSIFPAVAAVVGCAGETAVDTGDVVVASVEIRPSRTSATLGVDRIVVVTAVAFNASQQLLSGKQFTWTSDRPDVGEVNGRGVVTVHGAGLVSITAEVEGVSASFTLDVADRPPGASVAFTNVNILTMEDDVVRADRTVVVRDGYIAEVGRAAEVTVPDDIRVVDGAGRFLMPGLADMHVHPTNASDLIAYIASGVTTVLDMGNGFYNTSMRTWKEHVRNGELDGPNVYVSANVRGTPDQGDPRTIADTPEQGRALVRANREVDFVKVYNALSVPTFQAVVAEAEAASLTVIGHGVRAPGMSGILAGGLKMVAHAEEFFFTTFQNDIGAPESQIDAVITQLLDAGAYVTATLSINEAFAILWGNNAGLAELRRRPGYEFLHPDYKFGMWPQLAQNFTSQTTGSWRRVMEFEMHFLRRFHDAGVPLLLGTDSPGIPGMVPGFSLHEDLRLHVEMGLTPYEALRVGTVNAGNFVRDYLVGADAFGLVAEGQRGDLILVTDNPLSDLSVLRRPEVVVVRGRVYTKRELDDALEALRN